MAKEKKEEWYVNIKTGEISKGKVSGWTTRIGPYPSKAAAAQWRGQAAARNEEADLLDLEWEDQIVDEDETDEDED